MTLVLGLDCAVSGLGVALVHDGTCLASLREEGRDQAARLLPAVASVLRDSGQSRSDVSLIAVTVGPGSFTGVRVGLAAARGLAVGLGVPLAGLVTTSVLHMQAVTRSRLIVAAIDSRLGDWFCSIGEEAAPFAATATGLAEAFSWSRLSGFSLRAGFVPQRQACQTANRPASGRPEATVGPVVARFGRACVFESW